MTKTVQDKLVVAIDYKLTVEGEVLDSTNPDGSEPLEYIHGIGQIIPGLEKALSGMEIGESTNVVIPPGEGYGDIDPDAIVWLERDEFPEDMPLELGMDIQLEDDEGAIRLANITAIENDRVQLDLNHPLAGQELTFDVTIVGLRDATPEELDHGHVHSGHHH